MVTVRASTAAPPGDGLIFVGQYVQLRCTEYTAKFFCQEPMSPRPYRMARRRESTDATRARILSAARDAISDPEGAKKFSMEEVASRAGVARMTVYYRFGSLQGLLEALFDSLAFAGGIAGLAQVFELADAGEALDRFVAVFTGYWESDRTVLRRLGALATLD